MADTSNASRRQFYRMAYRCLVRLHPRAFREEFGEEMLWIFEEAEMTHGATRLLTDGLVSLIRQWIVRPHGSRVKMRELSAVTSAGSDVFAWDHIGVPDARLPFTYLVRGALISLAMFAAVWLAASQAVHRRSPKPLTIDATGRQDFSAARASVRRDVELRGGTENSYSEAANRITFGPRLSGSTGADWRERQQQQQHLAVQVAVGANVVLGAPELVVGWQGLVPEVPKSPAGQQFSAWLQAFNSGDRAQIEEARKLFKDPPQEPIDGLLNFRQRSAGVVCR